MRKVYTLFLAVGVTGNAAAQTPTEPLVTITGGRRAAENDYGWTFRNHYRSPIVHVEFPQYRSSWRLPPDGWSGEVIHGNGVGRPEGKFITTADDVTSSKARGRSAEFKLGVRAEGTPSGLADVLVRFADGTEVLVKAECPIKEPTAARHISLISLGLIFGLLLVRAVKGRRHPSPTSPDST